MLISLRWTRALGSCWQMTRHSKLAVPKPTRSRCTPVYFCLINLFFRSSKSFLTHFSCYTTCSASFRLETSDSVFVRGPIASTSSSCSLDGPSCPRSRSILADSDFRRDIAMATVTVTAESTDTNGTFADKICAVVGPLSPGDSVPISRLTINNEIQGTYFDLPACFFDSIHLFAMTQLSLRGLLIHGDASLPDPTVRLTAPLNGSISHPSPSTNHTLSLMALRPTMILSKWIGRTFSPACACYLP